MSRLYLGLAILAEVIGTSSLKASDGFSRLAPAALALAAFALAFYFLALALRTIPVGVAYAVWSGIGIVLISVSSRLLFGQALDAAALVGIALILAGVLVINLLSGSSG